MEDYKDIENAAAESIENQYDSLIIDFWELDKVLNFSAKEKMFYYTLVENLYRNGGYTPVRISNRKLGEMTEINESTLRKIQKKMKDLQIIDYQVVGGKNHYEYKKSTERLMSMKNDKNYINSLINNTFKSKKMRSISPNTKSFTFLSIMDNVNCIQDFEGNQNYLRLAYAFWRLWYKKSPKHRTLITADPISWTDEIRKIIELDGVPINRLLAIYTYFSQCANEVAGYNNFWFKTLRSVKAFREETKTGVYRIDMIIDEVNRKIDEDYKLSILIEKNIQSFEQKQFESYFNV